MSKHWLKHSVQLSLTGERAKKMESAPVKIQDPEMEEAHVAKVHVAQNLPVERGSQ